MEIKKFKNYPNMETPLNAENLNYNFEVFSKKIDDLTNIIDTKWKNFIFHNQPNFKQMEGMPTAQYRRVGDFLYLRGMIACSKLDNTNQEVCKVQSDDIINTSTDIKYFPVASYMGETTNGSKSVILVMNQGTINVHFSDVRSWLSLDGIVLII